MEILRPSRFPSPAALEDRLAEVKSEYNKIISSLPPHQRQIVEEYHALKEERDNRMQLNAYNCGIQIGERRAKRK